MTALKTFAFAALIGGCALAQTANVNPQTDSYGAWQYANGNVAEDFDISAQGFDWLAKLPKKCQRQTVQHISGRDVLKRVHDSMASQFIEAKDVRVALAKIQPNQSYQQIEAVDLCGERAAAFIFLDKHNALGLIPAPEDWFMDLKK
ncbi:hypothetical protein ACKLNO_05490 [Neisseriaceae bacterium B1]